MRGILLVSRWYYPADTVLLLWLAGGLLAVAGFVLASRFARGAWRRGFGWMSLALAAPAALASLAMIGAETLVFEAGSRLCIAAYAALLAAFVWLMWQSLAGRPRAAHLAAAFLLGAAALGYLFPFGMIPPMTELGAEAAGMEGSNVLGAASGTLPVTEFADFECPACAMQEAAFEKLWGAFPGRIRYSFRHLPLKSLHPYARAAALASQCAAEQGAFWETKRLLFANQDELSELLSQPFLPTIPAGGWGRYRQCVDTRAAWPRVQDDIDRAKRLRLRATPSILIGNVLVEGMLPYPRLELIVRRALNARNLLQPQRAIAKSEAGCGAAAVRNACAE
jgi:hypothetical protein